MEEDRKWLTLAIAAIASLAVLLVAVVLLDHYRQMPKYLGLYLALAFVLMTGGLFWLLKRDPSQGPNRW